MICFLQIHMSSWQVINVSSALSADVIQWLKDMMQAAEKEDPPNDVSIFILGLVFTDLVGHVQKNTASFEIEFERSILFWKKMQVLRNNANILVDFHVVSII